jgi:hypothetical protein
MGEELVRSEGLRNDWRWWLAILLLAAACKPQAIIPIRRARGVPQVQATVVTIRTTLQPANRTTTTAIVITDDHARATEEIGTWRLFDLKGDRVAFVDDFARTYRYESLKSLVQRNDAAMDEPVSEKLPRAEYILTGAHQQILGLTAREAVVKLGAYQRVIWFAKHPLIPDHLFLLMEASETPGPAAPIAKEVDDGLLAIRAFPLLDHAELPYAKTKIVIDRAVVSVDRHKVARSLLQIPEDYEELKPLPPAVRRAKPSVAPPIPAATTAGEIAGPTPPPPPAKKPEVKAPASHRPASSSPPRGRKTPKGGSRSSAKGRKGP